MANMLDYRKLVAEAIGAFALIFMGAGSIIVTGGANLVAIGLAYGLAMALLVSTLGHVSGGFYNPALTIGLWVTRRLTTMDTIGYIVAQLVGASLAALALVAFFPEVERQAQNLGTPMLNPGITFAQGVGIEIVLTVFLMLAVFGTALDARGPKLGGLMIGLVLTMGFFAAGPLTGGAMNPARAFGPALVTWTWDDQLVYWIGPIVGAVLAALLYHYVFMNDEEMATAT